MSITARAREQNDDTTQHNLKLLLGASMQTWLAVLGRHASHASCQESCTAVKSGKERRIGAMPCFAGFYHLGVVAMSSL